MEANEYQKRAVSTAIYPRSQYILYPALGLFGEAGEVAEHIKKAIRDDGGIFTTERRAALLKELGDVGWYLANLAADLGFDLDTVFQANLDKLQSRKERGVLQGSGDDR